MIATQTAVGYSHTGVPRQPRKRKKFVVKTKQMIRAERRAQLYKLIADVVFERVPSDKKSMILREAKRRQALEIEKNEQRKRAADERKRAAEQRKFGR